VLDKEDEAGLRQQKVLAADAEGVVAKEGEEQHAAWKAKQAAAVARASVPTLRVRTITETKEDTPAPGDAVSVTFEATGARRDRPHGKRFGVLVHAVLATVALDASDEDISFAARIQGRIAGASDEEVTAARDVVRATLAHPLLERARKADRVEREVEVMLREDDGTIIEGVVDLAFYEADAGWTVVDFKTDLDLGDRRAGYERQVSLYARAITAATGAPARGALLSV
jgi:ATP-dependent exoDNAse (exonuclease V) beta subunit